MNFSDGLPYITANELNSEHKALCVDTNTITKHNKLRQAVTCNNMSYHNENICNYLIVKLHVNYVCRLCM